MVPNLACTQSQPSAQFNLNSGRAQLSPQMAAPAPPPFPGPARGPPIPAGGLQAQLAAAVQLRGRQPAPPQLPAPPLPRPALVARGRGVPLQPLPYFAWQPGMPRLGEDFIRDDLAAIVDAGDDGAATAAGASTTRAEMLREFYARVMPQIRRLQAGRQLIDPLVERLERLSPLPAHRLSFEQAKSLLDEVTALRERFYDVTDDDIWVAAVSWPLSKVNRLQRGVTTIETTLKELNAYRSKVESTEKSKESAAATAAAAASASSSVAVSPSAVRPGPIGAGAGATASPFRQLTPSSPSPSFASRPAAAGASPAAPSSPRPTAGSPAAASGALPMSAIANLMTSNSGQRALRHFRAVDGGCCYIEDCSEALFTDALQLYRREATILLGALVRQCTMLRSGEGTKWDVQTRVRQASQIAGHLFSTHSSIADAPKQYAIWNGRRAKFGAHEYELLANDPSAVVNDCGLMVIEPGMETQEEIDQLIAIGAVRAQLVDADGKPLQSGSLSNAAAEFSRRVSRASTSDEMAAALSQYENVMAASETKSSESQATSLPPSSSSDMEVGAQAAEASPQGEAAEAGTEDAPPGVDEILSLIKLGKSAAAQQALAQALHSQLAAVRSALISGMNASGMSIIRSAIGAAAVEIVELLLQKGFDASQPIAGGTLMHALASKGGQQGLDLLKRAAPYVIAGFSDADKSSAILNADNTAGSTALHIAARNTISSPSIAIDSVLELVLMGADPTVVRGGSHKTPLQQLAEVHIKADVSGAASGGSAAGTSKEAATAAMGVAHFQSRSSSSNPKSVGGAASFSAQSSFASLLEPYLLNSALSDITLRVRAENTDSPSGAAGSSATATDSEHFASLPAHRIVLAAHSPYFKAMLEGGWKESAASVITLDADGVSDPSVRRMLRYCYTGRTDIAPDDAKSGLELLNTACAYSITRLINELQTFLIACLQPETAWAIYISASHFGPSVSRLRLASARFILLNYEKAAMQAGLEDARDSSDVAIDEALAAAGVTDVEGAAAGISSSAVAAGSNPAVPSWLLDHRRRHAPLISLLRYLRDDGGL